MSERVINGMSEEEFSAFSETLKQFLIVSGWTQTKLARHCGISSAALSQFMAGKYPGDNEKLRLSILSIIEREKSKSILRKFNPDFIDTSISRVFFDIADVCRNECDLGVIVADAGIGKTESARKYVSDRPEAILIEADNSYTATVLIREIIRKIGHETKGTLNDLMSDAISRLVDSDRLIIIDEAEHLPRRALESIRRIHDKAGVGVLLVGMPQLLGNLRGLKGDFAQLYSRIGIVKKLFKISEDDTKSIVSKLVPGKGDLWRVYYKVSNGNTRRLFKIIKRSYTIAEISKCEIDAEVVVESDKYVNIDRAGAA